VTLPQAMQTAVVESAKHPANQLARHHAALQTNNVKTKIPQKNKNIKEMRPKGRISIVGEAYDSPI